MLIFGSVEPSSVAELRSTHGAGAPSLVGPHFPIQQKIIFLLNSLLYWRVRAMENVYSFNNIIFYYSFRKMYSLFLLIH